MVKETADALFPTYARFPITLVKGKGSRVWDDQGKEYVDFMCGLAVTNLGHAPERVKEQLEHQLDELWHVSNLFHIPGQERLADKLCSISGLDRVFFCSTGAEANEAAIKLARRYSRVVKGTDRYEIITFKQSFHGRTMITLTATGQKKVQMGFDPLPPGFVYADYNDMDSVRSLIGNQTCAFMLEMVQGEGGVLPAEASFVRELAGLCKERDLLLIVDEIQTGMGRTGSWFAFQHYGIKPDIITLAKGLGSGFPIGAMLGKEKLAEGFTAGSHGSTFGGTPIAMAAGAATVDVLEKEKLPERAAQLGGAILEKLNEELGCLPFIKDIRGKGLLIGIECAEPVADILQNIHEQGVLVVSAGPNVIRLVPSLNIPEEDVIQALSIICKAIQEKAAVHSGLV